MGKKLGATIPLLLRNMNVLVFGGSMGSSLATVDVLLLQGARICIMGKNSQCIGESVRQLQLRHPRNQIFAVAGVDARDKTLVEMGYIRALEELGRIDVILSAVASSYIQDYLHISSDNVQLVQATDESGFRFLAIAAAKYGFCGRLVRVHPAVHNYGVTFQDNWAPLNIDPSIIEHTIVVQGGLAPVLNAIMPFVGCGSRSHL